MSSLGVVPKQRQKLRTTKKALWNALPNSVVSSQSDPLRNGLVDLLLNSKGSIGTEGLVGRLKMQIENQTQAWMHNKEIIIKH